MPGDNVSGNEGLVLLIGLFLGGILVVVVRLSNWLVEIFASLLG